jgi:hypothetical protein
MFRCNVGHFWPGQDIFGVAVLVPHALEPAGLLQLAEILHDERVGAAGVRGQLAAVGREPARRRRRAGEMVIQQPGFDAGLPASILLQCL